MKQAEIKKVAENVFKKRPELDQAFVTSDGFGFASKNAANLHKTTNPKKQKIEIFTVSKEGTSDAKSKKASDDKSDDQDKTLDVSKVNKVQLQEDAKALGIEFTDKTTKAELVELINAKNA